MMSCISYEEVVRICEGWQIASTHTIGDMSVFYIVDLYNLSVIRIINSSDGVRTG